jgi:hypothetical protein
MLKSSSTNAADFGRLRMVYVMMASRAEVPSRARFLSCMAMHGLF